jgi:hypothetical protein
MAQGAKERPDFEASLTALIATFAVLIGVSITDFLDPAKTHMPKRYFWWVFIMMIALMLRYIVGSAIHLKYTYGNRASDQGRLDPPRSRVPLFFFKDGAFLVWFGVLAVGMAHSTHGTDQAFDLSLFFKHAEWFLIAGISWSASDCVIRYFYSRRPNHGDEWPTNGPWTFWIMVDLIQLYLTVATPQVVSSPLQAAQILAAFYVLLLYVDFKYSVHLLRS